MIKKIILFLVALTLIAAAAAFFFGSSILSKGIKTAVEKFGPEVTQTAVRLDEVDLSILSGNVTLSRLYVGNPDGYKSEHIFALGQIDVDIDVGSVLSDKIIVNKIYISQPEISYEKNLLSSNVKALQDNIEAFTGSAEANATKPEQDTLPEVDAPAEAGSAKQVVIKQLIIEDGTIFVGLMGAGATVPLPRIEMNDIGETDDQKSVAEIIDLVLTEVIKSIGPALADAGSIVGDGSKAAIDQGQGALNKATESIKGLFGK